MRELRKNLRNWRGSSGQWSQHKFCLRSKLSDIGFECWVVLCRARSWIWQSSWVPFKSGYSVTPWFYEILQVIWMPLRVPPVGHNPEKASPSGISNFIYFISMKMTHEPRGNGEKSSSFRLPVAPSCLLPGAQRCPPATLGGADLLHSLICPLEEAWEQGLLCCQLHDGNCQQIHRGRGK